jgi:uncharacterized protein YndB with AHSA1/START domain
MSHPFEIELQTELPATPEQVWEAIATGPGVDSWFMGRNDVEPREGGIAGMETGGHRAQAVVTGYEPGARFASRTAVGEDGRFMAFEYLIEGRSQGSTVLRVVHSGMLGDDWQDEYDALRRGWPFHLNTLREYLTHFAGRTALPVFGAVPTPGRSSDEVQKLLADGLGLTVPVAVGAHAHGGPTVPTVLPPLDGEVVWADGERFAIRGPDAIHTFHHGPGIALMFHHLFAPQPEQAEGLWQHWLTTQLATNRT